MTMVTLDTSRRERKKSAARSKIIATAVKLFSKHGIAGVTVDQIADAADIGKGTIYNYFPTKEAIVIGLHGGYGDQGSVRASSSCQIKG